MSNSWPDMFFGGKSPKTTSPASVAKQPPEPTEPKVEIPAPAPRQAATPPPAPAAVPPAPAGAAWPAMFFGGAEPAAPATQNGPSTPAPKPAPVQSVAPPAQPAPPIIAKAPGMPPAGEFDTVAFEQFLDKGKKKEVLERRAGASKIQLPAHPEDKEEEPAFLPAAIPESPVVPVPAQDEPEAIIDNPVINNPAEELLPGDDPFGPAFDEAPADEPVGAQALHATVPVPAEPDADTPPELPEADKTKDDFNEAARERAKAKGYEPLTLPEFPAGMGGPSVPQPSAKPVTPVPAPLPELPEDPFSAPPAAGEDKALEPKPVPEEAKAPLPDLPPGVDPFSIGEEPNGDGDAPADGPVSLHLDPPPVDITPAPDAKETDDEPLVPGLPEKPQPPVGAAPVPPLAEAPAVIPGLPEEPPAPAEVEAIQAKDEPEAEPLVPGMPDQPQPPVGSEPLPEPVAEHSEAAPAPEEPIGPDVVERFDPESDINEGALATVVPTTFESANQLDPVEEDAGTKKFTLTNGEVISGKVLSENETELFIQSKSLGVLTIKKDHLAKKLMEVVLLNGDRVTGEIVAENKDYIYLRNASLGTLTIPRSQGAKNVVEAELANGNRIVGELVIETEDIVLIKSATLGTVSVDRKGMKHLAQRVEQSQIKSLL